MVVFARFGDRLVEHAGRRCPPSMARRVGRGNGRRRNNSPRRSLPNDGILFYRTVSGGAGRF